jgi:hypothetical protein
MTEQSETQGKQFRKSSISLPLSVRSKKWTISVLDFSFTQIRNENGIIVAVPGYYNEFLF